MNHISQTIKIEIIANLKTKSELKQKTIFTGFYSFARCIRKSGTLIQPNQIGFALFEGIDIQVSLQERLKYGGYRCITLRVHDIKGGDFVENPDLTMVICSLTKYNQVIPIIEAGKEIPLMTSPEGLYRRIDIGVNNYNPISFASRTSRFTF